MKSKTSTQDKVSELEKKIIELQRELDAARKNSTSIWCKLFDTLVDCDYGEEEASTIVEVVSETVLNWVTAQRSKINRTVSSLGTIPPYTSCLNDLVISVCDPNADHSDLLPSEDLDRDSPEDSYGDSYGGYQGGVRVPSPPPSARQGEDPSLHMGPTKMLKVNVPKPFASSAGGPPRVNTPALPDQD